MTPNDPPAPASGETMIATGPTDEQVLLAAKEYHAKYRQLTGWHAGREAAWLSLTYAVQDKHLKAMRVALTAIFPSAKP